MMIPDAPNFGLRTASSYDIRTTYTSREWVPEIALYFLRNRWLHPMLGRFCSRDPVGYEGSDRSLREYAASNPEKYVDPDGTRTCTPAEHAACNSACLQQQNVTGNAHNCSTHYIINWGCFKWGVNKAPCKCHKKKQPQKGCKPCKPPVGSVAYRVDRDGAPHNDPDGNPIAVPHSHVFVMNQIPADAKPPATPCDCFWQEVLKDPLPGELAPEIAPAGGGGAT